MNLLFIVLYRSYIRVSLPDKISRQFISEVTKFKKLSQV